MNLSEPSYVEPAYVGTVRFSKYLFDTFFSFIEIAITVSLFTIREKGDDNAIWFHPLLVHYFACWIIIDLIFIPNKIIHVHVVQVDH